MAEPVRKRRILFDIKEGSPGDTYASIAFYEKHKKEFGQFVEAWVFDPNGTDEASLLGFFDVSPWQQNRRDHPPSAASPNFVLIDESGDQLWLSGAAIMGGTGANGAVRILYDAGFDIAPDTHHFARHFVNRLPVRSRFDNSRYFAILGKQVIYDNRVVKLLDLTADPQRYMWGLEDFQEWWAAATDADGWLGEVTQLTLYGDSATSNKHHHYGYQLLARGAGQREAWVRFAEPYYRDGDTPQEMKRERKRLEWLDECLETVYASVGEPRQFVDRRNPILRAVLPHGGRSDVDVWRRTPHK